MRRRPVNSQRNICFLDSSDLDFRGLPASEEIMQTTRRTFLGAAGAAAALGVAGGAQFAEVLAAEPRLPRAPASGEKVLFWVAASTPCDKNLKFDEELYKDLLAYLKANGADGVVVVPPFYYKHPRLDGLTRYFSMLFEQVKIPINLYHIPFATGVPISHELLHAMEKYPNLAGIKDSVSDPKIYHDFVAEFPKLNMRSGTTENLKYALDHDMGAILAEGNNFTKQIATVFAAKRAGKDLTESVAKLDAALKILREGGVDEYGPMKYALSLQMGTHQFYQRPPNSDVTDEQKAKIKQALEQIKQMG